MNTKPYYLKSFITYDGLPIKSGGAHSLGKITVNGAYNSTVAFLDKHTDCSCPNEVELTIYQSPDGTYNVNQLKKKARKRFGLFPKKGMGYLNDKKINYWQWSIKISRIDSVLDFVNENNIEAEQGLGPIEVSFLWIFKFKSMVTGRIYSDQEKIPQLDIRRKNSQIYLKLSNQKTMSAWFAFPFSDFIPELEHLITDLQVDLPFQFSNSSWKRWVLSKNNNWISRKVDRRDFNGKF